MSPARRILRAMGLDRAPVAGSDPAMGRQPTGRPRGRPRGWRGEEHVVMTVRLRPDQRDALEARATGETEARGGRRLDISRVLRAIIDKALRLKPPQK